MKPNQYFGLWTILCSLDALSSITYFAYFGLPKTESNVFIKLIASNLGLSWSWFWFPIEWVIGVLLIRWTIDFQKRNHALKVAPIIWLVFFTFVIVANFVFLARAFDL
jgi:hypothetical protein